MTIRFAKLFTVLFLAAAVAGTSTACAKKKLKPQVSVNDGRNGLSSNRNGIGNNGSGAPDATSMDGSNSMNGMNGGRNSGQEKGTNGNQPEGQAIGDLPNVYFKLDSDELDATATGILTKNAGYLSGHKDLAVVLRGHCDDTGTYEYNTALGGRRAQRVRDFLMEKGIESDRLQTVSFGKEMPAVEGTDEASRAKNRRVEFFVYTP